MLLLMMKALLLLFWLAAASAAKVKRVKAGMHYKAKDPVHVVVNKVGYVRSPLLCFGNITRRKHILEQIIPIDIS